MKRRRIKVPAGFKGAKVWNIPSLMITNVCPSFISGDTNESKRDQIKIDVKQITVLKKYPLKIVAHFPIRITNKVVEVAEANFMIGMDEKVFADFFPQTFAHLVFKKLLDDGKARQSISYEDFTSKLPKLVKSYTNVVPTLSYKKPYVSFIDRSGIFETRRRLAQYLRIVEVFEKKLEEEMNQP